jgi:hypothetical protein
VEVDEFYKSNPDKSPPNSTPRSNSSTDIQHKAIIPWVCNTEFNTIRWKNDIACKHSETARYLKQFTLSLIRMSR